MNFTSCKCKKKRTEKVIFLIAKSHGETKQKRNTHRIGTENKFEFMRDLSNNNIITLQSNENMNEN